MIHFKQTPIGQAIFERDFKHSNTSSKMTVLCVTAASQGKYWVPCSDPDTLKHCKELGFHIVFLEGVSHISWRVANATLPSEIAALTDMFWASLLDHVLAELEVPGVGPLVVSFEDASHRELASVFFEHNGVNTTPSGALALILV